MKQYMIHIEEVGDDNVANKKVYIVNKYQKEKIDKIIEEKDDDNSSIKD